MNVKISKLFPLSGIVPDYFTFGGCLTKLFFDILFRKLIEAEPAELNMFSHKKR